MIRQSILALLVSAAMNSIAIAKDPPSALHSWNGNGTKNTLPFTIDKPWMIHWSSSGAILQIMIYKPKEQEDEMTGIAANQMGEGDGSSYVSKPGTYYLTINAMGKWHVWITDTVGANDETPCSKASP